MMNQKEIYLLIGCSILFVLTLPISLFVLGILWILFIEDIEKETREGDKNHNQ